MQAVLCFGNEWHGDDGFGLAVYNALLSPSLRRGACLPDDCRVFFCANNAHFAPAEIFQAERIIIVDALQCSDSVPGELYWARAEDFITRRQRNLHDGGVEEFIRHLPVLIQSGSVPEVEILYITVEPVSGFEAHLSLCIRARIEDAGVMVLDALHRWNDPESCSNETITAESLTGCYQEGVNAGS